MYHVDHIIEAMSNLLSRWACPDMEIKGADKNGVLTVFSKKKTGLLMFIFATRDNLSVQLEFDLRRLKQEGRDYIETVVEIVITQLEAARKEKQQRNSVIVFATAEDTKIVDSSRSDKQKSSIAGAVKSALVESEILH